MTEPTVDLTSARCKNLTADSAALGTAELEYYIDKLDEDWVISDDKKSISRHFKFKNYYETMAFVNVAAMIAHQQDHHPDMVVSYNNCSIIYNTHSIDALSLNDFICAAKTDKALGL